MAGLIIGLMILAGGIVLLVFKKKVPGLILTIFGGVVTLIGLIILIVAIASYGDSDGPGSGNGGGGGTVVDDPLLEVPAMDGMTATEDKIVYETEYVTIIIEPDNSQSHPDDTVSGKTEDGAEWSTTNKDGTEEIHMKVDDKEVTAKVETKKDSDKKTNEKADAGKAAAAVSALVDTGYKKGKDNYNHNYAIWYVEPAQCLVYYPAQLELSEVKEDNTAIFTDKKSKAKLKISLDENNYSSMDEVESFIANTEYNRVLASGTDWFSCETRGKSLTEFSYTGLGQEFAVNVDLTYENKYDFVFEELRSLIKCQFVEGGKWVSTEGINTTGKTVSALQNIYENGIKWKLTQWYFADGDFIMIYPDIFTKVYHGNDATYFTDPVTGAYIKTLKQEYGGGVDALAIDYGLVDYTRIDEDIIRGYKDTADYYKEYHYIVVRDSLEYHTIMYVPYAYDYLYQGAAAELSLKVPGDDVGTFEMQDLYFKDYNCFVTVPLQFKYDRGSGSDYYYYDSFNGLDLHIRFSAIPESKNTGNIFDIFEVTADDEHLIIGENTVKWLNEDGLFVGGHGNKTACYAEIVAVDAERAYLKSWDRFNIRFEEKAKAQSIVDEVKKEVKIQKIKDETINGKPGNDAVAVTDSNDDTGDNDSPQDIQNTQNTQNTEKPGEEKPAIIAEATNHEKPEGDEWRHDEQQNVVLWYKDYDDYDYMTTTAYKWFLSEDGGAAFSHGYKTTLLAYMNVILKYNEYEINIDNAWVEKVAVPTVDGILEEWYHDSNPPVGSMLGDEITSVFEAYCRVLEIDVPDYVSNAMEPTVLDEESEEEDDYSSGETSGISRSDVAGMWAPDDILGNGEKYKFTKGGDYSIYSGEREVDYGWYTVSGKALYLQSFNKIGDDYEILFYDPLMDQIVNRRYGQILYRTGEAADEDDSSGYDEGGEEYSDDIYDVQFGDDQYDYGEDSEEYEWIEKFDGPLSGIDLSSYKTTTEPLFERVWDTFEMDSLKGRADEWGMGRYGNSNAVSFIAGDLSYILFERGEYGDEITDVMNRLEALGLYCVEKGSFEQPHQELFWIFSEYTIWEEVNYVEYYGTVSGYEDYGPVRVVISDSEQLEISWLFEDYASFPIAKGEMFIDESFVHFCQGFLGKQVGGPLDAETVWFVCQRAGYAMNGPEQNLPDMESHYYVIVGDDSSNPEWFTVLGFDIGRDNNPVFVYKGMLYYEDDEWKESQWYPDGGWIMYDE